MNRHKLKLYCAVAAFTVALYLALSNLDRVKTFLSSGIGLLTPFIMGAVIAFVLSGLMSMLEARVFSPLLKKAKFPRALRAARPLALITTYLLMFGGLSIVVWVVAPQLATSVVTLGNSIPSYLASLQRFGERFSSEWVLPPEVLTQISAWFESTVNNMLSFIVDFIPGLLSFVASLGGGVLNFVIGLIVSAHLLLGKEKLLSQLQRLNRAFIPVRAADRLGSASRTAVETFGNYVSGQLLDALLVGVVSVIGLSLFRFPYAMLIGVVMGITNIIPFFGPFIGAIPGFFIILMIDPVKALWYLLFVVVLQQVDGNFIAPKIIGGSVGLPPLWVLFAVTVGGGIFGIPGMILGTPVFAVIYILLGRATRAREAAGTVPSTQAE